MRMDRLTLKAQEAIQQAQQVAEQNKNPQIDVEHLLVALLTQGEGLTVPILQQMGANVALLQKQVQEEIG